MKIAVFGLGYVGTVSAACLASLGHEILGVDISESKVGEIRAGRSPIVESQVDELIADGVREGRLDATLDGAEAVRWADVAIVCVGTPSQPNGSLDTGYVEAVCREIGEALAEGVERKTVVIRSTLLPGTTLNTLKPILESSSGKCCGEGFGLAFNPEFLREGSAVKDFQDPPYTIIGGFDDDSVAAVKEVYQGVDSPLRVLSIPEAEMVKYTSNAFHALKITFANEIGNYCKAVGVDSHVVMDTLVQDTKLNISPAYLKPGFAYGGSCLPKDLRALLYAARQEDLELPLLQSIEASNQLQIRRGVELVMAHGRRNVGILGFSFKEGTDDLRESPMVELIEVLIGKGHNLKVYDRNVNLGKLTGANQAFLNKRIPHIAELMVDSIDEVLDFAEVLVVGNKSPEFCVLENVHDRVIVDLVRLPALTAEWKSRAAERYHGICW